MMQKDVNEGYCLLRVKFQMFCKFLHTLHNFMAAADSAIVFLELNVQWD